MKKQSRIAEKIKRFITESKRNPRTFLLYSCRLGFFDFVPDEPYLKLFWWAETGRKLDLKNPKRFNEKLQWLKLNERKKEYTSLVDKYLVKDIVGSLIGEEHIIKTIKVWDRVEDIDFDELPEKFVLKSNNTSGHVYICRDKKAFDISYVKKQLKQQLKVNLYHIGREWPYKNVVPKIIAEEYFEESNGDGLINYKFYCFNGEPLFLHVSSRGEVHATTKVSFVTLDWKKAEYDRTDYRTFDLLPKRPDDFDGMLEIARKLANGFKFIRVDLYYIDNVVYFSELTFYPANGFIPFSNEKQDYEIGKLLDLGS